VTNKDVVSPEETIIFQLPQVLHVEQEMSTIFVQMREHNQEKNGLTVLFLRIIPAGDDEEDMKAEREAVEDEEDAMVDGDDGYSWTVDDFSEFGGEEYENEEEEEEEVVVEEEEEELEVNEDIAGGDTEDGKDTDDDGKVGLEFEPDHHHHISLLNNVAGFGLLSGENYAGGGGSSSHSHPLNNTQEDDGNARPYFLR
jgi:hypothetical protein